MQNNCIVHVHTITVLQPAFRYDRFTDAFEHVSTVIDDIYKVWELLCLLLSVNLMINVTCNLTRNSQETVVLKHFLDQKMLR